MNTTLHVVHLTDRLFVHCFQIELEFRGVGFVQEEVPENLEKNLQSKM